MRSKVTPPTTNETTDRSISNVLLTIFNVIACIITVLLREPALHQWNWKIKGVWQKFFGKAPWRVILKKKHKKTGLWSRLYVQKSPKQDIMTWASDLYNITMLFWRCSEAVFFLISANFHCEMWVQNVPNWRVQLWKINNRFVNVEVNLWMVNIWWMRLTYVVR